MTRKWSRRTTLLLLAIVIITTVFFGLAKTTQYSAYAACRKVAMTTKGYAAWKYERTFPMLFLSRVSFSDGYNELACDAMGIGPFWIVTRSLQTLVACVKNFETGEMCPEDYFGVNP
jgi:hypothetical protein